MTARQILLIRESFETISEMAESVSLLFYGRLFQENLAVRSLFRGDIREQSRKFIEMLAALIEGLDRFDQYRSRLRAMGRRHVGYGVTSAHYPVVGDALLWALRQALERQFSAEAQLAWKALIDETGAEMMAGADESLA